MNSKTKKLFSLKIEEPSSKLFLLNLIVKSIAKERWKDFFKNLKKFWNLMLKSVNAYCINVPFV